VLPDFPAPLMLGIFAALTLSLPLRRVTGLDRPVSIYLPFLWAFFLVFTLIEFVSLPLGLWVLAALSFLALREYFTLADLRLQDRFGVLAAYAAIPFMFWFVVTDWYGMFVVSIPVFAFLVVPFLVSLGGREPAGSVQSVGLIVLGLFLLVYCIGHIGYLARHSTWLAAYLVAAVAVCDLLAYLLRARDRRPLHSVALQLGAPAPLTIALALGFMPLTGVPVLESVLLALLVPVTVAMGCQTIDHLEADLGVDRNRLQPGSGQFLNTLKSFVYTAPVAFHFLRYTLDAF
jgi:phosphatidate cytidylyltransferase